ncbi:perlucin [Elysia marginata]|uniref:Perlucin n=1 Tax=Elysia marginata TaxID=1093978 RepID=A0AAV4GEU6_9GAST|nr:perlucin [Elysia marginata]
MAVTIRKEKKDWTCIAECLQKARFVLTCVLVLVSQRHVSCHPAFHLEATSRSVSCTLNVCLISMKTVSRLSLMASEPNDGENEFVFLAELSKHMRKPYVYPSVMPSIAHASGKNGTGRDATMQISLTWKTHKNINVARYRCMATCWDKQSRKVQIFVTSNGSESNISQTCRKTSVERFVNNPTCNLTDEFQSVNSGISILQQQVETLNDSISDTLETKIELLLKTVYHFMGQKIKALESLVSAQKGTIASFEHGFRFLYLMTNFDVVSFSNKMYYVSKVEAPFDLKASDILCDNLGGHLLEVNDFDEYAFIFAYLTKVGGDDFFTGGNDIDRDGHWTFWHSKETVHFMDRWTQPPDVVNGYNYCLLIRLSLDGYTDENCNARGKFVCEDKK